MSHNLDMTTGKAGIAYQGETPWHGMGQIILPGDSIETRLEKGGLDWKAIVTPSHYYFNGELREAPNSFHMVRSDTGDSLSVMSKRFKPHQPREVVEFTEQFISVDPRFEQETLGSLKGGRTIWSLAKFQEPMKVLGEDHKAYLLMSTAFDGSLATRGLGTLVRVVCDNTMTAAMWQAIAEKAYVTIRHSKHFDAAARAEAADELAQIIGQFDQYKAMAEAMHGVKLAAFQVEGLFKRLTIDKAAGDDDSKADAPTGRARAALERLLQSYRDTLAEGTEGGTGWAVLNGVTRYVDHNRTVRDTAGEGKEAAKFHSSLFGSGASLKREAVEVLAEIGGLELAA